MTTTYTQANFYRALKGAGRPLRAVELGRLLGVSHVTAFLALTRLAANGWVVRSGRQKSATWRPSGMPGTPGDMRGLAAGSARGRIGTAAGLQAMWRARGIGPVDAARARPLRRPPRKAPLADLLGAGR
jgi:hypothetical protein